MDAVKPLVVILGPTASGKTDIAIKLARQYDGEIICADSRTIYRGLDIGTAKPTMAERAGVLHYGLDVVDPSEHYSAYDFQKLAYDKLDDIRHRGCLPIIAGGTGLYIDGVVFGYTFGSPASPEARAELEARSVNELQTMIEKQHTPMPENFKNKRHLVRAIERRGEHTSRLSRPMPGTIIVGIKTPKETLRSKIELRAERMFCDALYSEAELAAKKYGWDCPGMTGNIYRIVHQLLKCQISRDEAVERSVALDTGLAKRQLTWFRRNPHIVWLDYDKVLPFLTEQLLQHNLQPVVR